MSGAPAIHARGVPRRRPAARHAFILPVVLVLVGLLTIVLASFIFFVRAETAGTMALRDGQQARLAAESGLETVIVTLRAGRDDSTLWYDVPDRFQHALVWSDAYRRDEDPVRKQGSRKELLDAASPPSAWRFCIVAPQLDGPKDTLRYGITPESSKLNLNTATDAQIEQLLTPLLLGLGVQNAPELVAALLDWRDTDEDVRPGGAENEHYNALVPPYRAKNSPLDTIEELLLVKGFTAAILYGEDTNRNGILDPNEDDGGGSAPVYDNGDGTLNHGLAPFVTIWSREPDTAGDNKPRINLRANAAILGAQIADQFTEGELSQETIGFLLSLKQKNIDPASLKSPAELYQGAGVLAESGGTEETGDGGATSQPGGGAASQPSAALADSPVTLEELPYIMDRFTVRDPTQVPGGIQGLININTAPAQVLALVPGMTGESAASIISLRQQLAPEALRTTAWPLVYGAASTATFHEIAPYITTKAYQFHVESVGYADHLKLFRRYEWIIEMQGALAQIRYYRDLTSLGLAWPIDDEKVQGRTR